MTLPTPRGSGVETVSVAVWGYLAAAAVFIDAVSSIITIEQRTKHKKLPTRVVYPEAFGFDRKKPHLTENSKPLNFRYMTVKDLNYQLFNRPQTQSTSRPDVRCDFVQLLWC
jgi:hypothetical protein